MLYREINPVKHKYVVFNFKLLIVSWNLELSSRNESFTKKVSSMPQDLALRQA